MKKINVTFMLLILSASLFLPGCCHYSYITSADGKRGVDSRNWITMSTGESAVNEHELEPPQEGVYLALYTPGGTLKRGTIALVLEIKNKTKEPVKISTFASLSYEKAVLAAPEPRFATGVRRKIAADAYLIRIVNLITDWGRVKPIQHAKQFGPLSMDGKAVEYVTIQPGKTLFLKIQGNISMEEADTLILEGENVLQAGLYTEAEEDAKPRCAALSPIIKVKGVK